MRRTAVWIIMLALPVALFSQESADSSSTRNPGFLLATAGYTTNNNSARLANAIKLPAMLSTVSYFSGIGLWASADYYKYLGASTNTWEFEARAGWEKTFADQFDVDLGYTHRTFRGDTTYEGLSYKHAVSLSGAWRPHNFSLGMDHNLMIGETRDYFMDISLSYDFNLEGFPLKKGYLVFSPTLVSSLGTTNWLPGTVIRTWGHFGPGPHPGRVVPVRKFDYQYSSLILPVQYNLGSFTLSGAWFYSIPSPSLKELNWSNQSGFLISLSYSLIF